MKAKSLKSTYAVSGSSFDMNLIDVATNAKESVSINLDALLANPKALVEALVFAARTRLRNSTGGKSLTEAYEIVAEMAAAINAGKWEARAREAGETRHSPLILALAQVLFGGNVDEAQAEYDAAIAAACADAKVDPDPAEDDEEGRKALRKVKADYRKAMTKTPAINAALLRLEADAALKAAQAKAEAADKAAQAV
jgi:hypothetical protein